MKGEFENVLAVDPGATRAGWAILGNYGITPTHIGSGVVHHARLPNEAFQKHRLNLIEFWLDESFSLIEEYQPKVLVMETVPSRGAEIMDQLYLVNVMATTLQAIAMSYGLPVVQVSARTVQAKLAKRKEGVKVTKPQVRNGVLEIFPELQDKLKPKGATKQVFEESDAVAIGLWYCIHR